MRRLLSSGVALALLMNAGLASAFCRATTCRANTTDCRLDAQGCPTVGVPLIWRQAMPIVFRFQARGSALLVNEEARAAVRAAFFRWTDVICPDGRTSLRFVEGEDIQQDKPLDANSSVASTPFGIYFRDRGWPHPTQDGDGTLGLTTLAFGVDSGRITYADIEINTGNQQLSTSESAPGADLQTVVTHEVGHYIGLAHSQSPNAIMVPSLCESGNRCEVDKVAARRLGDDDRAAVCALFPPGLKSPVTGDGAASSSSGCASSIGSRPGSATCVAIAMLSLVGVRLVRRRVPSRATRL